jgi:hypothetical protein
MTFNNHKLMPRKKLNPDYGCTFKVHWPAYCLEEKGYKVIEGRCRCPEGKAIGWPIMWESTFSAQEVWDMYQDKKSEIDSYIGGHHDFPTDPRELLNLASSVSGYSNIMDTGHGQML